MDLCLPDDWIQRAEAAFRDDLGPGMPVPAAHPRHYVCAMRDWRALTPRRARAPQPMPRLVRWRASAAFVAHARAADADATAARRST